MSNVRKKEINVSFSKKSDKKLTKKAYEKQNAISEEDILKKKKLTQKEKNKQKYINQQKAYHEKRQKVKEKSETDISEQIPKKKSEISKVDVKKKEKKVNSKEKKIKELKKQEKEKKEKVSKNKFVFKNIINKIKIINEKNSDRLIPLGKDKKDKKKRIKRYFKEALFYSIIISLLNLFLHVFFSDINLINLFDIKVFNVVITLVASLLISFAVAFIVDYLVSELWVISQRKGDKNGNKRLIKS